MGIVLHWFRGSTCNGQPYAPFVETFCGKPHEEVVNGDTVVRRGSRHPHQVTCGECKTKMEAELLKEQL